MKKAIKALAALALLLVLLLAGGALYLKFFMPNVGEPENIQVDLTPARIERGKYLANHVALCMDCHSTRDWSKFSGPMVAGTLGKGGEIFNRDFGFPGVFYSKNISPTHLKDWTDGELFRMITTGVNKKGEAAFPVMPYGSYGQLDREDIYDIIAYVRSIPPMAGEVPERTVDFPVNFLINTMPQKARLSKKPPTSDSLAYGKYLLTMAGCGECHTPFEKGALVAEYHLAGGRAFPLPSGTVSSPNLTPDPKTGLGKWTREQFIQRFKQYADSSGNALAQVDREKDFQTIMPWAMYAGMTAADLGAIYAYLHSIAPIEKATTRFVPKKETR